MNQTAKQAGRQTAVKRYHWDDHQQLRQPLDLFINEYNVARRLQSLKELTAYEFTCKQRTDEFIRFIINPLQKLTGLYSQISIIIYLGQLLN